MLWQVRAVGDNTVIACCNSAPRCDQIITSSGRAAPLPASVHRFAQTLLTGLLPALRAQCSAAVAGVRSLSRRGRCGCCSRRPAWVTGAAAGGGWPQPGTRTLSPALLLSLTGFALVAGPAGAFNRSNVRCGKPTCYGSGTCDQGGDRLSISSVKWLWGKKEKTNNCLRTRQNKQTGRHGAELSVCGPFPRLSLRGQ